VRVSPLSVNPVTSPKSALADGASGRPPAPDPAPPPAVLNLRREVLEALRGPEPLTAYQVPCRWPVMRVHVLAVVRALHAEGLLERLTTPTGGPPAYRATPAGRALAAGPALHTDDAQDAPAGHRQAQNVPADHRQAHDVPAGQHNAHDTRTGRDELHQRASAAASP
jgi:hypothetical protein